MRKSLPITPQTVAKTLLSIVGVLFLAQFFMVIMKCVYKHAKLKGLVPAFYFDNEYNIPAFYSAMAILFCAGVLWKIGDSATEKKKKQTLYWKMLSAIFVFLALDEFFVIHEYLIQVTQKMISLSSQGDFLYFAWFIPYCLMFAVIGLFLLRFFFRLPLQYRLLFAGSGVIFIAGAVGMEMVGGKYWSAQGWVYGGYMNTYDLTYALIITVEETLEMLGIVFFAYSLCMYYQTCVIKTHWILDFHISLENKPTAAFKLNQVEKSVA